MFFELLKVLYVRQVLIFWTYYEALGTCWISVCVLRPADGAKRVSSEAGRGAQSQTES